MHFEFSWSTYVEDMRSPSESNRARADCLLITPTTTGFAIRHKLSFTLEAFSLYYWVSSSFNLDIIQYEN